MYVVKENDVYKRERPDRFGRKEKITFWYPNPKMFIKEEYDWYIIVALEKVDRIKEDRHLITYDLVMKYRWAIREGYNHELDANLNNQYDHPRNQNTIKGVQNYIKRIARASDSELKNYQ